MKIKVSLPVDYEKYKSELDWSNKRYCLQPEFQGELCVLTKDGAFRKNGDRILSIPHVEAELIDLFNQIPDIVLQGELANEAYPEKKERIKELAKEPLTPHVVEESLNLIKYYVYDFYQIKGVMSDWVYEDRQNWINNHLFGKFKYIQFVLSLPVKDEEEMNKNLNIFNNDGRKYAFLKDLGAKYQFGRNNNCFKIKLSKKKI